MCHRDIHVFLIGFRYSSQFDSGPARPAVLYVTWVKWDALLGWQYSFLGAFA